MTARSLLFTGPREVTVREVSVGEPGPEELLVEASVSAISPGTELLVYRGEAPTEITADLSIDALSGQLTFPTRYGYATVGNVIDAGRAVREWVGRRVFAFHPHQSRFCLSVDDVVHPPTDMPTETVSLLAAAETATNFLLDGEPRIGERVVVFGAGAIGLSTTRLLAEYPLESLVVVEPIPERRELAGSFGADRAIHPDDATALFDDSEPSGADLVFELSGEPATLDTALSTVGYDGRIVVGSWYGSKPAMLDLGGSFHRDRISIVSSQVSTLSPRFRGRLTRDRRREIALDCLRLIDTETLVTHRFSIREGASAYEQLDTEPAETLQVLFTYE